jgi:signal transduction histidine kinase
MRKRAEEIGADLTIHSAPGSGSSVAILLKMM